MPCAMHAAATYARVGLETGIAAANPHTLIEMLFDGAIVAVNRAREALAAGDVAAKGLALSRAIEIVEQGLRASLDRAAGGDLAAQLDSLYEYISARLLVGSAQGRPEAFAEVAHLLGELREAWHGIAPRPAAPSLRLAAGA